MSERGSFVTEFIYCQKCFSAVESILVKADKYLTGVKVPHWNGSGDNLPIIAGKIGGLAPEEELIVFEYEIKQMIEKHICHVVRVAVLAEQGHKIFVCTPGGE